jgi:ribose-phosphate pyrophosphokinase
MYVFGGSAGKTLAGNIATILDTQVGSLEVRTFANDELRVRVMEQKIGIRAVVVQSLSSPPDTNLVEFCLICDALTRLGVTDIIAVIPWLGYSKQDKVFCKGEPLSVKVIAKILQIVPIKQLITFDLHNPAILGFFDIPVANLTTVPLFAEYFKKRLTPKSIVVAPDAGSIKSSTAFAHELGISIAYMDKKRDLTTGEVSVYGISRPVEGADVIIIDDMIVTGETLIETAKYLKTEHVHSIRVGATHHLYVAGAQEAIEKSGIDQVVVTDTIEPKITSHKLIVLTVASMTAQELMARNSEI